MGTRNEDIGVGSDKMKAKMESRGKKPYRSPRLMVYGDLSRLTMGGGGTKGDGGGGGGPMTKVG